MKFFTKLFVGIMFLILGNAQSGMAQTIGDLLPAVAVDPATVADNEEVYVYLYNVDENKFIHGGGRFGAQTILANQGIRFKVISGTDGYYLQSAIVNVAQGSFLGVESSTLTYIDRPKSGNLIKFEEVAGKTNIYHLSTNGRYYVYKERLQYVQVDGSEGVEPDEWCLVTLDDYNTILSEVSKSGRYNITGLIGNARFLRNVSNADVRFWKTGMDYDGDDYCTTIDPEYDKIDMNQSGSISNQYVRDYGAFGCLEIGAVTASEGSPAEFYQEITGLKPGLYMLEAQAFFDLNDKKTYKTAYSEDNIATASNAYLFANEAETLIPALEGEEYATFTDYMAKQIAFLERDVDDTHEHEPLKTYFRRNVAASQFLSQNNKYAPDESFHRVRVYVNVTADEGGETGTLRLGVNKKGSEGRVYVDNFGLYYVGENEIGLDAYQRNESKVDQNTYNNSYPFHLSRKFVLNAWNAITLPVNVTAKQVRDTFGENAKLCKLHGVNPDNEKQILFDKVDLTTDATQAIARGGCYLIWVTSEPEVEAYQEYTFLIKKEEAPEQTSQDMTFPYGNIYTIYGVSCPEGMTTPEQNYKTVTTATGTLKYTYFYHRPDNAPAGSYVMSGGKMYHIPEAWTGLLGTCWYITDMGSSSNSKVMAIEGEGGTTDINGIVTEVPGEKAMEGVYNINGQKVADDTSLEGLPKGIYIVNGKKHVVK